MLLGAYYHFNQKVLSLKYHFPVWNKDKKLYVLESKKPKSWVSLSRISKEAKWAIVVSEDWPFFDHQGIDLDQLKIVIDQALKTKKLSRGASTITQQLVKNTLLSSERSLTRKAQEIIMALLLENNFTKNEILEIYLNLIELGKATYGVKAGSYKYFNKAPLYLNAKEGAFLAMLLPSPVKYSQSFRQKKLTEFAKTQVERILVKLRQAHIIDETRRLELEQEPLSFEVTIDEDSVDTHTPQL